MTNILLINKENCALKLVDEIIRETGNVRESLEEYYQFLKTQRRIMGLYVADFFLIIFQKVAFTENCIGDKMRVSYIIAAFD